MFSKFKRFPEDIVKFIGTQIILGLGALHAQGYMHRDMKLENIMIDQNGYIKLIDFGLAKLIGHEANTLCGTTEYMAPEMISEVGHGFAVDWWATGILLYEMVVGITPFFNKNRYQLFENIKGKRPKFPDRNRYSIEYSDELVDLISRLLEKDPQKRLGSNGDA